MDGKVLFAICITRCFQSTPLEWYFTDKESQLPIFLGPSVIETMDTVSLLSLRSSSTSLRGPLVLVQRYLYGRSVRLQNVRGCICGRGRGTSRDRASALGRGAGRVCKQASQTEVRICSPGSRRLWSSSPSRVFIGDAPHFPHPISLLPPSSSVYFVRCPFSLPS